MPSLLDLVTRAKQEYHGITLDRNINPYLYRVEDDEKVVDGDTIGGGRTTGFDTFESFDSEKARKVAESGLGLAEQKKLGLAGKEALQSWVDTHHGSLLYKEGRDKFGRSLISNPELTQHMVESGIAVPTDRYDEKLQSIYRAKQEKLRSIDPATAQAMEIQREYNIGRQKPGILERLGDTVDALQSGTQQAIAGTADFVLDAVTPGDNTLLNKVKSAEVANEVWGYDSREADFAKKEALHKFKNKEYVGAVMEMAKSPELWGESIPMVAEMAVGAGKFTALGKLIKAGTQGLKGAERIAEAKAIRDGATAMEKATLLGAENVGYLATVGDQTNRHIEEFTQNNGGVGPSMSQIAGMTAMNALQLGLDRFAFNQLISTKGGIQALKDTVAPMLKVIPDNALGTIAKKVATTATGITAAMGTEATQEYLQTWAEMLNTKAGTKKYGDWMDVLQNPETQDEAIIGALAGAGMGGQMRVGVEVPGAVMNAGGVVTAGVDALRTRQPSMSANERREVELAGGVVSDNVGYSKQSNPSIDTFQKAMQSSDMTMAKDSIDEYMYNTQIRLENGELSPDSAEYIDTRSQLTEMYREYYNKAQKTVTPEFQAASRDYKRYKEDPTTPPDVLGSSRESLGRNIQDIIDSGMSLDEADTAEMESLAKDLGIDTTQYKVEQEAIKPFKELEGKSVNQVTYESLIGENGVQRVYEKLKAAVKAKDNNAAIGFMRQLENFKNTQVSKVEALQKGLAQYEAEVENNPKAKVEVPYSVDQSKKFKIGVDGKIDTPKYAINATNSIINEASKTIEMLDKVLQAVQLKQPTEVVQEAKVVTPKDVADKIVKGEILTDEELQVQANEGKAIEAELQKAKAEKVEPVKQSKPKEVETPTEVTETQVEETKPKEVVKDMSEVKEEPTEADVKAQAKEARTEVRKKEVIQAKKSILKDTLKKLQIKAKGGKWKVEDKAYLQDLGTVVGNTVELNDDVLEAMSIVLINWIGTDAESTMKVTDKDIKRMLKVKGDKASPAQLKMMSGKGIFRKNAVQSLGQAVVNELGLELPEGVAYNVRQSIVTGLGNTLVAYMRDQGMITTNEISADEWNKVNKLEGSDKVSKAIPMVQFNYDAIAEIKNAKQMLKEDPELRYSETKEKGPQYGKATSRKKHEYRNRSGKISEKDEERLSVQDKIEHNVKDNVYKAFKALDEYGKIAAGWKEVSKSLHVTTRQAIQAVNNSIERSLEHLEDHIENAEGKMYSFNYFMSGNGRDMIDSNTFNPQSDKIHRHMDYTGEPINPLANERHEELFKLAVMQGLKIDVDKMTPEAIENEWSKIEKDETILGYAESLAEGEVDPVLAKEIAEYAGSKAKIHTLDSLVALGDYIKAKKNNTPMLTTLQLEVDAVTSGWILALLQNPMFDMQTVKEYLAKGGVYLDNMDANYQARVEAKELDSYETVMEAVKEEMKGMKIPEESTNILKIDRKFAKGPFMTNVTYGAGIAGVKADIVDQYIQNLYDKMVEGPKGLMESKVAIKGLTGIFLTGISNPTEYMFDSNTYNAIEKAINDTYGKAVENALSKKYKAFTDVRNTINKAFEEMFKTYSDKYAEGMNVLKAKGNITAKELKDLEASLVQYIPTIKSPNGTDVQIYSKEKLESIFPKDYEFQTQFLDKVTADITTQAEMKRIAAAKAAGGVVPIHFIDGAIIGELLKAFQMTGIYDAGMFNLGDVDSATEMYNETIMKVSKEYNLLEEVIKEASRLGIGTETMQDLKDASKVANANREIIHNSDLNTQHFAMAGIAYKQKSKSKPISNDKVEKILQDTPNEVVNGIERLKGKVRTEDMNAIMSVIKQFKEC